MSNLGNKEVMAKNIQYYMDKKRIDRKKLSTDLSISYTTLTDWLKAKTYPRIDKIEMLANYFSISKADLVEEKRSSPTLTLVTDTTAKLEEKRQIVVLNVATKELQQQQQQQLTSLEEYKKRKAQKKEMGTINWLGSASAGTGEFLTDSVDEEIELPIEMIPNGADFCLSINGDSMEPIFHDDDYIFIEKQMELFSGAIGVVVVNNEAFLKRIWFENNHARLESFNKEYEDIIVTENDDFRIVGKVVM